MRLKSQPASAFVATPRLVQRFACCELCCVVLVQAMEQANFLDRSVAFVHMLCCACGFEFCECSVGA